MQTVKMITDHNYCCFNHAMVDNCLPINKNMVSKFHSHATLILYKTICTSSLFTMETTTNHNAFVTEWKKNCVQFLCISFQVQSIVVRKDKELHPYRILSDICPFNYTWSSTMKSLKYHSSQLSSFIFTLHIITLSIQCSGIPIPHSIKGYLYNTHRST